jgi:hypothetical protein
MTQKSDCKSQDLTFHTVVGRVRYRRADPWQVF